jgi:hypothetical protein
MTLDEVGDESLGIFDFMGFEYIGDGSESNGAITSGDLTVCELEAMAHLKFDDKLMIFSYLKW